MLRLTLRYGLPSGVQNSVIGFANVVVQANINVFGTMAVAGCGAYAKLEGFAFLPITSFTIALTTFVGQNLGAGKHARAKRGAAFGVVACLLAADDGPAAVLAAPAPLFTAEPEAIAFGVGKSRICSLFFFLLAASHSLAAVLRGAGKAVIPMISMLAFWRAWSGWPADRRADLAEYRRGQLGLSLTCSSAPCFSRSTPCGPTGSTASSGSDPHPCAHDDSRRRDLPMISTLHDPKNLSSRRRYFLTYSLVFLFLLPLVFFWHLLAGKTLISNGDGWNQHVKALAYFGWYLRSILRSAAGGHLPVIPDWDFCIGEGSDILNALHYYAMGDPLNLLSAAVPVRYTYILYSGLVLLRLYLAGAAFSALCFGLGHTDRRGILAGAVSYAFCCWAIANASRHPYFLNPLIYFPLLILGAERILQGKGTVPLTLAVAVAAASNFYFFYMLALLTALYVLLRLFFLFRGDRRGFFRCGLRIAGASLLGAMLAGVVLLPLLHIFLSDSRFGLERSVPLFYPLSYYLVLPATIVTTYGPNWLCIGVSPPVLLALFLLFLRRGRALLKTLVLIGLVFICFPWFGRALNGFAYVSNRWCWAFVLLCCYLLTSLWEELLNAAPREQFLLFVCTAAYTLLCFVCAQSRNALSFFALCLLLISLFSIRFCSVRAGSQLASSVLCVLVCVGAVSLGFWKNAPGAGNYISETVDVQTAREGLLHDDPDALRVLAGESPVRYAGSSISANAGMLSRLSSADYSWSLSNPHVVAFRTGLGLNDGVAYFYQDYDGRTALLSLSAVDCYMKPNASGRPVPYGFDPIGVVNVRERETASALLSLQEELGGGELSPAQRDKIWAAASQLRTVYRNRFALPLAYGYRRSVSDPVWEEMSALQKQEAMLSAVHLSEPVDGLRVLEAAPSEHELPYETGFQSYEISWQDFARCHTTADNCALSRLPSRLAGSETYVELRGLDFDSTSMSVPGRPSTCLSCTAGRPGTG